MRRRSVLGFKVLVAAALAALPLGLAATGGCGGGGGTSATGGDDAGSPVTTTLHPDAPPLHGQSECTVVTVTGIPVPSAKHVQTCTHVEYSTNPPSGGNHWPIWAAYTKYDDPVPREMYVHDLEHGGLVLAHNTDSADRAAVVAALDEVFDGFTDPLCVKQGGVAARLIVTPDPEITTPIAIAAWGATYTATCIDKASLNDFVVKHAGHGTEAVCSNGQNPLFTETLCLADGGLEGGGTGGSGAGGAGGAGGGGAGGSGGAGGGSGAGGG